MPGFLALDAVCDERDANARAILSHAWPAPDAVRIAGGDEIVVGWERWTATRVRIALTCDDHEQRAIAARNVPALLNEPVSLAQLERLVEMISS